MRALDVGGDVDEGDDMDCELPQDRPDDVRVEDVRLGAFFGEAFDGLSGVISICCRGDREVESLEKDKPLRGKWRGSRRS